MKYATTDLDPDSISVSEDLPPHHWRTEIPNIVLDMGLTPYELALYVHLKRTAGDKSKCTKGTRRLSEDSGISMGQIKLCKESLSQPRKELSGKPLIVVQKVTTIGGMHHEIIIVNIWPENINYFTKGGFSPHENPRSLDEKPVHPVKTPVHGVNEGKNHNRKEHSLAKPIVEEVKNFAKSLGLPESDGEYMFFKWEASGWITSGKPIKNWKSQIQCWKSAGYLPSQKLQQAKAKYNTPGKSNGCSASDAYDPETKTLIRQ